MPPDTHSQPPLDALLAALPDEVVQSFTPAQRAALWTAARPSSWRRHPINLRLSFGVFRRRYFITIVGGSDLRSVERVRRDRCVHPWRTMGNILFILGIGATFYLFAIAAIVLLSNLIEF